MSPLRIYLLILVVVFLSSCDNDEGVLSNAMHSDYLDSSALILDGKKIDTAYLFGAYVDKGAGVVEYRNGETMCPLQVIPAQASGTFNTSIPGVYTLTYSANDSEGNPLKPVTRTIHVVENSANFLNGLYKVTCTCTAVAKSLKPVTTSENYTAVINPGSTNNHFELVSLNVGPEKLIPQTHLSDNTIWVGFFTAEYDYSNSGATGTLSSTKNSFTIETNAQTYSPNVRYSCINVYTKLLTIKINDPEDKKLIQ